MRERERNQGRRGVKGGRGSKGGEIAKGGGGQRSLCCVAIHQGQLQAEREREPKAALDMPKVL